MSQTGSNAPACMNGAAAPPTLAAPSRPQFYAGQLLTDSDLSAIVGWSRALRGLDRFVLGWGAVCGLSVTADPANPSGLIVGSGYAIGPWGDDLVLGADAKLDLSAQCPKQAGGCAKTSTTAATNPATNFGIPAGNVTTLDVFLMPSATQTDPRRMAGISLNLPGDTAIQYARVTDGAAPCVAAPSADATDPVTTFCARLSAWRTAAIKFITSVQVASGSLTAPATDTQAAHATARAAKDDHEMKEARAVSTKAPDDINAATAAAKTADAARSQADSKATDLATAKTTATAAIQVAFAAWTQAYPTSRRPFLATLVNNLDDATLTNPNALAALAFAIVDDGRASALAPACPAPADAGPGVPLARVWLGQTTGTMAKRSCVVLAVDDTPPRRHPLATAEPWPAPAGSVNLARWFGLPVDKAAVALKATLGRLGFSFKAGTPTVLTPTFDQVLALVSVADPIAPSGARLDIQIIDAGDFEAVPLGLRVAWIIGS